MSCEKLKGVISLFLKKSRFLIVLYNKRISENKKELKFLDKIMKRKRHLKEKQLEGNHRTFIAKNIKLHKRKTPGKRAQRIIHA